MCTNNMFFGIDASL